MVVDDEANENAILATLSSGCRTEPTLYVAGSNCGAGVLLWERRGRGLEKERRRLRGEDILRMLLEASGVFPPQLRACVHANMQQSFLQCISLHFLPSFMYRFWAVSHCFFPEAMDYGGILSPAATLAVNNALLRSELKYSECQQDVCQCRRALCATGIHHEL